MRLLTTRMLSAGLSLSLFFAAACNRSDDNDGPDISPKGPPPAWAPDMHREMQAVIEQLDSLHLAPIESLSPQAARGQKTIFDAAEVVARMYDLRGPLATADTFSRNVPVAGGTVHARFYKPGSGNGPFPAILY